MEWAERVLGWSPLRVLLCGAFAFGGALLSAGSLLRFVSAFTTTANWHDPIPLDAPNSLLIVLGVAGVLYAFATECWRSCEKAGQGRLQATGSSLFMAALIAMWLVAAEISVDLVRCGKGEAVGEGFSLACMENLAVAIDEVYPCAGVVALHEDGHEHVHPGVVQIARRAWR